MCAADDVLTTRDTELFTPGIFRGEINSNDRAFVVLFYVVCWRLAWVMFRSKTSVRVGLFKRESTRSSVDSSVRVIVLEDSVSSFCVC